MAFVRPLIDYNGNLQEVAVGDYIQPAILGAGTPSSNTVLDGNGNWVTVASLNYWTKFGANHLLYDAGDIYTNSIIASGDLELYTPTGESRYIAVGSNAVSYQLKTYNTNPRFEFIGSGGVLYTVFNNGNYRIGTGADTGFSKLQVNGSIQQSVTSSMLKANNNGVLVAAVDGTDYFSPATIASANYWTLGGGNVYRATGSVGIGISTPASEFHVSSAAPVYSVTATNITSGLRINVLGQATNTFAYRLQTAGITIHGISTDGNVGIGNSYIANINLAVIKNITGSSTAYGVYQYGTVQSDVTVEGFGFRNHLTTAASAFTLPNYFYYSATQGTIGAGSAVGTQTGFFVGSSLTGATNNFGFRGLIASGAGRWNVYMDGTANNHMAGSLGIGTVTELNFINFNNRKNITGATIAYGNYTRAIVQSDVTTNAYSYRSQLGTQAASFTLTDLTHFGASQETIGENSTVTNQTGFIVASNLIGAINNYGFRGAIPSGAGRWNVFMDGTAQNHFMGDTLFGGTTTAGSYKLQVFGQSYFRNLTTNAEIARFVDIADGSYLAIHNWGIYTTRTASYIRPNTNNNKNLYIGENISPFKYNTLYFGATTINFSEQLDYKLLKTSVTGNLEMATGADVAALLGTSASGNYIQNQFSTPQVGNAWIGGVLRANTRIESSRRGYFGTYVATEVQGIWSIGSAYGIDTTDTNNFGSQYGLTYSHTNAGAALPNGSTTKNAITSWGHQILFTNAGVVTSGISISLGSTWQASQAVFGNYTTTLYSSTSYSYISPTVVSYIANNLEIGKTGVGGILRFRRTSDGAVAGAVGFIDNNTINITSSSSGVISFTTNTTEKARIDSSGYFLVNTTSPTGTWKMQINGGSATSDGLYVNGNIQATGNIIGDGYFSGTSSDRIYKSYFKKVNVYDVIDNISVYSYNHKLYDNKRLIGSVAQNIERYFPELITKDSNGRLRVDNYGYAALALQLGKETKSEVERLKERVKELETRLGI